MISLKEKIHKNSKKLLLVIVVPLVIFMIIISVLLWYTLFMSRMREVDAKTNEYIREIEYTFEKVKSKHYFLLNELLLEEYKTNYDEKAWEAILDKVDYIDCDTFNVAQVNYYRVNKDFVVYDTDYEPDMGLDFKKYSSMMNFLNAMQPGDIITDGITFEYFSGKARMFIYIRLEDGSWFEIGILFDGFFERLHAIADEVFDDQNSKIVFLNNPTEKEKKYLSMAMENDKPIFHHTGITTAQYFVSRKLMFTRLNFLIDMRFLYALELGATLLELIAILIVFSFITKRMLKKFSRELTQNIEVINENVQNFHLSGVQVSPKVVQTEVSEIQAISDNFIKMREEIIGAYEETTAMNEELEASFIENQDLLNKMETLLDIPDYLLYLDNIEHFLIRSFEKVLSLVSKTDYSGVSIVEDGVYNYLDYRGVDVNIMNRLKLKVTDIPQTPTVDLREFNEEEFYGLYPVPELYDEIKDIRQMLVIPISSTKHFYGSIILQTKHGTGNKLTNEDLRIASYFAKYLNGYLILKEFGELEEDLQKETINALIRLLEKHDPYTKGHSEAVAHLASEFALFMNLGEKMEQDLYWAGIVHDMGKILIPHDILNKPSRLSDEEFDIIKKHPVYAWDVLKDNKLMKDIAIFIKHHHEKYDGRGYPDGLKGDEIPYESRILALADSWDAMVSERIYKKGIKMEDAVADFRKNAGKQFDPHLVEKWLRFIESNLSNNSSLE